MRICLGQLRQIDDEAVTFAKQLGLQSVQLNCPLLPGDKEWAIEDLYALKKQCDDAGLVLETIENVPIKFYDSAMLGLPDRDEQIERYQQLLRNLGKVGIPILGYHFVPTSVWRTSYETPGRGGALVSSFEVVDGVVSENKNKNPWKRLDVPVPDVETMWANYEYFMNAVLPVAEEAGVKMALHPDDPPFPVLADVARLFIDLDSFKRAEAIANGSPSWGLDLCLGCCSELGGAKAVDDFIKYFGPKNKIFYVHFRDVQGTVPNFKECFLGEGNFDPAHVIDLLDEVGFTGYIMDDHVPIIVNDDPAYGYRARGYEIGYMQGLLNMQKYRNSLKNK